MSSRFTQVDLSKLPAPDVIEALDFEAVLASMKADVIARLPSLEPVLNLESEPVTYLLEAFAYREVLLRSRLNDAARAVLLAEAGGADLEHLAALFGVARLTITPADPAAFPPVAAVMEADVSLRLRAQLALEGFTTAGSVGAYEFHARSADGSIKDVSVSSPAPGSVLLTVLSVVGSGVADPALLEVVAAAVNSERVRPLCDLVFVVSVVPVEYDISAALTVGAGPDGALVIAAALAALEALVAERHRIGLPVRLSAIYAALHRPGVEEVSLASPLADIIPALGQAPFCTSISVIAAA